MTTAGSLSLLVIILYFCVLIGVLICIPMDMACRRGRSMAGWCIFAIFFSPLLAILALACMGETDEKRKQRIQEEEGWRQIIRNRDAESK